jgi:hypothetical protein
VLEKPEHANPKIRRRKDIINIIAGIQLKVEKYGWVLNLVRENYPSMHKVMGFICSATKRKK